MKQNKKALYESVMAIVAKEIKKALNENADDYSIAREIYKKAKEYSDTNKNKMCYIIMYVWHKKEGGLSLLPIAKFNTELDKFATMYPSKDRILGFTNDCFDGEIIEGEKLSFDAIVEFEKNKESWIAFETGMKSIFCIKLSDIGVDKCEELLKTRDERFLQQNKYREDPLTTSMSHRMNKYKIELKSKLIEKDHLAFKKYEKQYGISVFHVDMMKRKIEKALDKDEVMSKFNIKDKDLFMRKVIESMFDIAKEMENNQE